jgi:hypothetical protein
VPSRTRQIGNSSPRGTAGGLITPDVVRHCDATPDIEPRSLGQIKEFSAQDTAMFPDSVQTIKHLIAEGNHVAAWVTYEGTQQGPMGPLPPSGRKAQFDFGSVFRIDNRPGPRGLSKPMTGTRTAASVDRVRSAVDQQGCHQQHPGARAWAAAGRCWPLLAAADPSGRGRKPGALFR